MGRSPRPCFQEASIPEEIGDTQLSPDRMNGCDKGCEGMGPAAWGHLCQGLNDRPERAVQSQAQGTEAQRPCGGKALDQSGQRGLGAQVRGGGWVEAEDGDTLDVDIVGARERVP